MGPEPAPEMIDANDTEAPECNIRRGKCLTHNIKGEKKNTSTTKWGKVKTGYGWIYSKKVTWLCRMRSLEPVEPEITISDSDRNHFVEKTCDQDMEKVKTD